MFNKKLLREEILRRQYHEDLTGYSCIDLVRVELNFNKTFQKVHTQKTKRYLNNEFGINNVVNEFSKYDYQNSSTGNYKIVAYCFPDEDVEMCIQTCLSDILGRIDLDKQFLEGLENKIIELKKEL